MSLSSSLCFLPALMLWLMLPCTSRAQTASFESLTIEQGLSQGMIYDILQTRDGFLWVATKDGLNRYDGYNFKVFAHNPFDPYSVGENTTLAVFEDSRDLLWVATESKGMDVYDPRRGRFHHFPKVQALTFAEGKDGSVWVMTLTELMRLSIPDTWKNALPEKADLSEFVLSQKIPLEGDFNPSEYLMSLWPKEDGNFVLFSSMRHFEVSVKENVAKPLAGPPFVGAARGTYQNGGHVWIGCDPFAVYHLNSGKTTRYTADGPALTGPVEMQEDRQGNRWLLFKKMLWQLEPGKPVDYSKPDWVLDQDVKCLSSDRNGNLWVGTFGYGLRKINPKRKAFHSGAPNNSIWRLWRSPGGTCFWRNVSDIYRYDAKAGTSNKVTFANLPEVWNRDMIFDEDGTTWLLSTHKKDTTETLTVYGSSGMLKQQYKFDINAFHYSLLTRTRDGNFWITEAGTALSRFDPRSNQISRFEYSHLFGENAAQVQALAFVQDGNGDFWIGTQQGLVKCSMSSGAPQFQLMQTDPNNPQGLNHNSIACMLPDPVKPGELLWIGTKGGGINRLDIRSGKVLHITSADGLPDMVVYGILPGNEDPTKERPTFWCSTNRGLAKIAFPKPSNDLEKPAITVFSAAKGLQGSEFNTQAFFKAADGELLFGGVNGLNHFFPEEVRSDTSMPSVFIVGVSINNEPVEVGQPNSRVKTSLEYLQELRLDYDENNVSFEFAALDFTAPGQNRYRYRLVGVDDDWVETQGTRFAHFAHLPPGRYELRLQGSNGEGGWQEATNPIVIVVRPPWYNSNLAYLCYALLLAWGGWRVYQFQIRRVKEREQLAFEHRETERLKAMEQVKTNFFNNVTHEFRTPLTLMLEPLRRALPKISHPEALENVRLAEANSRKLLGLVNQLLDIAKLESGQMALDLRLGDLGPTVRDVFERFLPLAEKRGLKLTLSTSKDIPPFEFDPSKVELVLNNLISNALKFTPEGGKVNVALNAGRVQNPSSVEIRNPSSVEIRVTDTGIGIPPEAVGKIFDRFYQVDSSHTRSGEGTGIGLTLSKELAELMGGGIRVESEIGKGSTFTFWIPASPPAPLPTGEGSRVSPAPVLEREPEAVSSSPFLEKGLTGEAVVLVIEDNAELRHFIKNSIRENWQVVEASNGEEGARKALELLPDLIISDVMMPRKDGYALCDELKGHELTAHIPIILLTAKSGIESKLKGLRRGADDYLTKPFNTEELLVRMENLVETRRKLRLRYQQELAGAAPAPNTTEEAKRFLSDPDRAFLRRFTLVVEQHLSDENMGVEEFAQKMLLSRTQLFRKIKALTNQNVTDFVRDYRLNRAYAMLKNREGMVYEVAAKVGFSSESYFSRAFRGKFGVPPSQIM